MRVDESIQCICSPRRPFSAVHMHAARDCNRLRALCIGCVRSHRTVRPSARANEPTARDSNENRQAPGWRVFENQPGLDVIDFRAVGEAIECEVSQVVRIAGRDMDQEIVAPSHVKDTSDLWQLDDIRPKRIHQIPRMLSQADRDHRLEPHAKRSGIDIGVVTPNHSEAGEASHPFETGRGSHTDGFRKSIIGDASILLQNIHDGEVNSVELVCDFHFSNYIRFLAISRNLLLQFPEDKNNNQ